MKKIITAILALVMGLCLVSCGAREQTFTTTDEAFTLTTGTQWREADDYTGAGTCLELIDEEGVALDITTFPVSDFTTDLEGFNDLAVERWDYSSLESTEERSVNDQTAYKNTLKYQVDGANGYACIYSLQLDDTYICMEVYAREKDKEAVIAYADEYAGAIAKNKQEE